MTKIDLFSATCYIVRGQEQFGLYDDKALPENPVEIVSSEDGTAKIENKNVRTIYFVPIDKNIKQYKESRCDALLICIRPQQKYDFYFVELKEANKVKTWIPDGIDQLRKTILCLKTDYSFACLSQKMAFLANKSHPWFHSKHKETMENLRLKQDLD